MKTVADPIALARSLILGGRTILWARTKRQDRSLQQAVSTVAREAGIQPVRIEFGDFAEQGWGFHAARRPFLPDSGHWHGLPDSPVTRLWEGRRGDHGGTGPRPAKYAGPGNWLAAPSGRPLSGRSAARLRGEGEGPWVDPRPVHDPSPALAGRAMVLIDVDGSAGLRYLHWLALACLDAAERDGRPAPAIFGLQGYSGGRDDFADLAAVLGWTQDPVRCGDGCLLVPQGDPALGPRDFRDGPRWAARLAARREGAAATRTGGLWSVRGEGRSVHAIRAGCGREYDPRQPDKEKVYVAAVADGVLSGHFLDVARRLDDDTMAGLAMRAWEVGTEGLWLEGALRLDEIRDILHVCARHGRSWGGAEAALAAAIRADLGPGLATALESLSCQVPVHALASWATGAGSPGRRLQFLAAFPALATLALDPEVTRLVDEGRPPLPRLCEVLIAPPAAVRRVLSQPEQYHDLRRHANVLDLGAILSNVDHGRLPPAGSGAHWYALYGTVHRLQWMVDGPYQREDLEAATRLACTVPGRTWPRRRSRLAEIGEADIRGMGDMLKSLSAWLEDFVSGCAPRALAPLSLATRYGTLARLADASAAWHADPVLHARSGNVPESATWPVPFGTIALDENGFATCLGSRRELVDEGASGPDAAGARGLSHCVASYAGDCLSGECLIVSVRSGRPDAYRRVTTLELRPDAEGDWLVGGRPYRAAQHRGLRNASPPGYAVAWVERLRRILAAGHPVEASALDLRDVAEAPPRRRAYGEDLLPRWRPILPRAWSGLDLDAILAELGVERYVPLPPDAYTFAGLDFA